MKLKLKTVDVWDTLLRRKCHPDTIKYATARYVYFKYFNKHNISDLDVMFNKRIEIEREIGKRTQASAFDDEYLFEEVIHEWCVYLFNRITSKELADIEHEVCQYEFDLELILTEQDSTIANLLNEYPSEKTLFLSDFYMSKSRLQALIDKNGLHDLVHDGISSADIKLNKRSGRLFDYVKENFAISASEWLHIGDNEWSDVKQPEKRGIKCIHYVPSESHEIRLQHESNFHDKSKIFQHALDVIESSLPNENNNHDNFKLGIKCSPFIVGYVLFILEKAFENNCEKIFFFTREGEFFIKAFEIIIEKLKFDLINVKFPEYEILEVSRLATFAASIGEVNVQEMMRVWNLYSTQSIHALFKTLNIDELLFTELLEKYSIDPAELIRYPWQDSRVQKLFADSKFIHLISSHRDTKKEELLSYLKGKGLSEETKNVCVVDVGWRGTIQDNIALVLPNVLFHGVYLGLAKYLNPQPKNSFKYAYGPDLNHSQDLPHYLDSVAPIEMITNSPSGSVVGYTKTDEGVVALRKVDAEENKAWENFTQDFQNGILTSLETWKSDVSIHVLTSKDFKPLAMKIWGGLISGSSENLNDAFENLNHNETFGLGGYVEKSNVPSFIDIFSSPFNWKKRKVLIDFVVANQWSDGIRKKRDISFLKRHLLASIIDFAIFYKHNLMRR